MALHAVLSALRSLILDGHEIPADTQSRKRFYRETFSGLDADELEELVSIPPEKLSVYTSTVFSGHRSTLDAHFPVTFALLRARCGRSFDAFELVRELHATHPWKGNATLALAHSFVQFLSMVGNPYRKAAPEVADLAHMECLALEVARGFNHVDTKPPILTAEDKGMLRVEELLEWPVQIPENVRWFRSCFDVLGLRLAYFQNRERIPQGSAVPRSCCYVAGRDRSHCVRWLEIAPQVYRVLDERPDGQMLLVEELAGAFLESKESDDSEDELFQEFMMLFTALEECGVLYLPAQPTSLAAAG